MSVVLHPILRYASALGLLVIALVMLALSAFINIHSVTWLVGIYCCIVVTLFSLRQRGNDAVLKAYRAYMTCMGLYFLVVWMLHVCVPISKPAMIEERVVWWAKVIRAGTIFLPVCFLRFSRQFSGPEHRGMKLLELTAWGLSFLFYALNWLNMFAVGYRWSGKTWAPIMGGAYVPFTYFTLVVIGVSTAYSISCLIKSVDSDFRARLFYFLIGSIPMWLTITGNFLLSIGINIYPAAGIFFIIHIAILAYAVLRKKVFEITVSLRRGAAYAVASLVLGIAYGGVLWLLTVGSGLSSYSTNFFVAPLFMALSGFFLAPFVDFIQTVLDRSFFRLSANRQRAFDALAQTTSGNISLPVITQALTDFLQNTLSPRNVAIYLETPKKELALFTATGDRVAQEPWPKSNRLEERYLADLEKQAMLEVDTVVSQDGGQPLQWIEKEKGLLAKVAYRDRRLGCVLLGARLSDEPYSDSDKELIRTALAHISLAMANALAFTQLEEMQKQTARTLNGLNAGVISMQYDGKVIDINEAARHMLGIKQEPDGLDLKRVWPLQPLLAEAIQRTLDTGKEILNQELTLEGPTHVLLSTQVHQSSDQEARIVALLHDITDYKKMEDLIRKRAGLAEAGEMIAAINHEIRNVLQPIKYQIRVLRRSGPRSKEEELAMDVMADRLTAMDQLLENLRNLARPIDLRKRRIDAKELVESVWRDIQNMPISSRMQFRVITDCDTHVNADGHWLRHVIYNLIRNAVEASQDTPTPVIEVFFQRLGTDTIIQVKDRGSGIPEELKAKLFEPFVSGKGAAGTGLGLSISRRVIELHQGSLSAQSNADGTSFFIRLPHERNPEHLNAGSEAETGK